MEIQQFRLVVRARDFDRSQQFYSEVLGLPLLQSWDGDGGLGALYRVGVGFVELRGRPRSGDGGEADETFDYQGVRKLSLTLLVASAEKAYEELIFRDPNISGGLKHLPDGALVFETHDPDSVRIIFRQADGRDD